MKTFVVVSFLISGLSAWAGPSTSGGGIGVLCKTASKQTLTLLDLFEASSLGQRLVQSSNSVEDDYAIGLTRLRHLSGDPRPVTKDDKDDMVKMFGTYAELTDKNLPSTKDAGIYIPLPANCHLEQIAIYQDSENKLLLNKKLWNQLDSLNKAALILHESIYKMQRLAFYEDSHQARRLVRDLFLANGPTMKGVMDGLTKGQGLLCFAGEAGTNSSISFVWQRNEIHLLSFAGEARLTKTVLQVPVSIDDIVLEPALIGHTNNGYKVVSTPQSFEVRVKYFNSEMPIPHITWNQIVRTGELLSVGMNVNGRVLSYPVSNCFKY